MKIIIKTNFQGNYNLTYTPRTRLYRAVKNSWTLLDMQLNLKTPAKAEPPDRILVSPNQVEIIRFLVLAMLRAIHPGCLRAQVT